MAQEVGNCAVFGCSESVVQPSLVAVAIIMNDTVTENQPTTGSTSSILHQLEHALRSDDKDAVSFLQNILKYLPSERYSAKQCLSHKFLLTKGK